VQIAKNQPRLGKSQARLSAFLKESLAKNFRFLERKLGKEL
jgi:hypothetical protein